MTTPSPETPVPHEASPSDTEAPPMAGTNASASKASDAPIATPTVRVEGLAEPLKSLTKTLDSVDHELQLLSHASKYSWVNQRLILLRNALIALGVLVTVVSIPEAKFTLQSVFDICAI